MRSLTATLLNFPRHSGIITLVVAPPRLGPTSSRVPAKRLDTRQQLETRRSSPASVAAHKVGTRGAVGCSGVGFGFLSGVFGLGTSVAIFSGTDFGKDFGRGASTGALAVSMISGLGFSGDAFFFGLRISGLLLRLLRLAGFCRFLSPC